MSPRLAFAGLLLLTVLTYRRAWSADWVYEDSNAAFANAAVSGQQPIAITRARWLSALSHRIVYRLAGGGPRVPHLVNLALHLVNGSLVYAIAGLWLTPAGAWLTAAIFLVHPLQSEAVLYVASRSELLAATFGLAALWLALSGSLRRGAGALAWLCLALGVCAKESIVVVVPLLAVLQLMRRSRPTWGTYAALLVPVALIGWSVWTFDYQMRAELSPLDYAATQAAAIWRYLGLVLVPLGQSVDHDFDLVTWSVRYLALAGLGLLAAMPILASLSIVNGDTKQIGRWWDDVPRVRVGCVGLVWMLVALAPRLVMRIPEVLNEHQCYFPMVGVSLLLASLVVSSTECHGEIETSQRAIRA